MSQGLARGAHVHFMGVGGFGINPIARVMHQLGYEVSGCDMAESPLLPPLRDAGVPILLGHNPGHLDEFKPDALVISSAIPGDNQEVWAAANRGIPVYKRSDILGALMTDFTGMAVAGTHGKTTTSAMLSFVLEHAGFDPTFIVGGVLNDLGINAKAGTGPHFVIEADEYDRMFMGLHPQIAVITTLELDHPDMFESLADVQALFMEFVGQLPDDGLLIANYDDAEVRKLAGMRRQYGDLPVLTYGLAGGDWMVVDVTHNPQGGMDFTVMCYGEELGPVSLLLPGLHNVQNALAVLAAADAGGVPFEQAAAALSEFSGVGRRFEVKGEAQGVIVIDDYAHHPTAIQATLTAARWRYGKRAIWAVWQPHTFQRTKALLEKFAASFMDADHVIITDVYRSRDVDTYGVGPENVLERMRYHRDVRHISGLDAVIEELAACVSPGDVVIVMSAGDATRIGDSLLDILRGNAS